MAEAARKPKKVKVLSEETKKRKRESNRIRAQTRITIGRAFTRWRELKDEEGCPTDAALALLLLDFEETGGQRQEAVQMASSSEQMDDCTIGPGGSGQI